MTTGTDKLLQSQLDKFKEAGCEIGVAEDEALRALAKYERQPEKPE